MGFTETLFKYAPTVAGLLGGPPAAMVATGLLSIAGRVLGVEGETETLVAMQNANPSQMAQIENALLIRLKEIELEEIKAQLDSANKQIESVNATMRAESSAANWPTWTWRPFLGFIAGVQIFGTYFVLPLLGITPPTLPSEVMMFYTAILGAASWGHSMALKDPSNTAITKG